MAQVIVRNEEFWRRKRRAVDNRRHLWKALLWPLRTFRELPTLFERDEEDPGLILQVFEICLLMTLIGVGVVSLLLPETLLIAAAILGLIVYALGALLDFVRRAWLP